MAEKKIRIDLDTDALVLVNLQKAYLPGGGMPIKGAAKAVAACRRLCANFDTTYGTVLAYPFGSVALKSTFKLLPDGTDALTLAKAMEWVRMRETDEVLTKPWDFFGDGADFMPEQLAAYLNVAGVQQLHPDCPIIATEDGDFADGFDGSGDPMASIDDVLTLGDDPRCDAYSAFKDKLGRETGLAAALRNDDIRRVYVAGLPFVMAVRTAKDAAALGFQANLVESACAVNVSRMEDLWRIRQELQHAGVRVVSAYEMALEQTELPDRSSLSHPD